MKSLHTKRVCDLLEEVLDFLYVKYRDSSQYQWGEIIHRDARPIFNKVVDALGDMEEIADTPSDRILADIVTGDDGFKGYWPTGQGMLMSYELRQIADYLDYVNASWENELEQYYKDNPE